MILHSQQYSFATLMTFRTGLMRSLPCFRAWVRFPRSKRYESSYIGKSHMLYLSYWSLSLFQKLWGRGCCFSGRKNECALFEVWMRWNESGPSSTFEWVHRRFQLNTCTLLYAGTFGCIFISASRAMLNGMENAQGGSTCHMVSTMEENI